MPSYFRGRDVRILPGEAMLLYELLDRASKDGLAKRLIEERWNPDNPWKAPVAGRPNVKALLGKIEWAI